MKEAMIAVIIIFLIMLFACGGKVGPQGPMGLTGMSGHDGGVGPMGPEGTPGITGATGATGAAGTSCSVVPSPNGAVIECADGTSQTISNGATGATGATGAQGATGATGAKGTQGATGATGAQGTAGAAALPCSVENLEGSAVITCPNGTQSIVKGITMVQFCSKYPDHYPDSFPEWGFCISNVLYATYWDGHQAFTAEVVPGTYESTSPQGCNFVVKSNCEVVDL